MKKILLLAVIALALPMAVFATSAVNYANSGGTLSGSNSGLSLSRSLLTEVDGLNGGGLITGDDLGSVAFSTGALMSGSVQMGGVFAGGGSFTITGNGTNGIPNGTLFSGQFDGPTTWTMTTLANGTHDYSLLGTLSGPAGSGLLGVTVDLTINTGKGFFNGNATISGGDTIVSKGVTQSAVPEPASLSLMGTGLLALAGVFHRKLKAPR